MVPVTQTVPKLAPPNVCDNIGGPLGGMVVGMEAATITFSVTKYAIFNAKRTFSQIPELFALNSRLLM